MATTTIDNDEVIVSCENIHKTYLLGLEGVPALRGIALDVYHGELLVVYGTSGGGKSTLLNILGTIDVPTKGNLALFDHRVTDRSPDQMLAAMRSKKLGFVFQSFNLLSTMTSIENVSLPMIVLGERSRDEIRERAIALLKEVGLGHRLDHYPSMLSGGEQQRVTIARALANDPQMLLLDEPTGDLDSKNTDLIMKILLRLNIERRITMVMVTHDVYMKQYAHRVLYLRDGKVHRIETIDKDVRQRALDDLINSSDEQLHQAAWGIAQSTKMSIKKSPEEYATASAQRPLSSLDGTDEDMDSIVQLLFANTRRSSTV
ncbi:ABC transporter, putative [Bodo saltans]|uniref:ABC transporter, putative n=1 Tax=Bodo saltans TaxID=75058 RepID=A0A0S4JVD0_BODSA|nr:ABC transporter, putative [Bodo saltans]|eukprot:CUG94191.1 ABC transporter, putative [Bodo saltans]